MFSNSSLMIRSAPLIRLKLSANSTKHIRFSTKVNPYDHQKIEEKWQKHWDVNNTFLTKRRAGKPKKYVLDMFPYPSGAGLHVGHPEGYTATDIMARYYRMKDFDVLHPMGWDAFGLPAEQHAINSGTHPLETTLRNIATFKRQLKSLGFSYDWSRELSTTDDDYVRWTQWIFLQFFKADLAAQSEVTVNWCPALGTVLANEEIIDGLSERGNHPVVRMPLRQWILRITRYTEKLEGESIDRLNWPEGTLTAQKQWIGRSTGASVKFKVDSVGANSSVKGTELEVYTTRPDTIMGVTYLVLAPEHSLVAALTTDENKPAVEKYISEVVGRSDLDRTSVSGKTGVFLGSFATHALTGERLPVWIADYVLNSYGTGAIMAVPAHDKRDFDFATLFRLPIKQVIASTESAGGSSDAETELPFVSSDVNTKLINSGDQLNGLTVSQATEQIVATLSAVGAGEKREISRLRDWVFSRQRYWGEPIPIYFPVQITTPDGTGSPLTGAPHTILYDRPIAMDDSELPLKLPEMVDFHPGNNPEGCLARAMEWRYFQRDGQWFARETNTMPQWAGSCWYYLRFTDPKNKEKLFGSEGASWLPVDLYVGGQEHAVLHLLYARFWHKVLFDLGIVDHAEPFLKLVHQGMILGSDNEKMSKSRGNVINPDDIVRTHGADVLRLYEMFMGPLEAVKPWQTEHLVGSARFRDRVYSLVCSSDVRDVEQSEDLKKAMHKYVKKVSADIERLSFNTLISASMIYLNTLKDVKGPLPKSAVEALVLCLSPVAPHLCEECWETLGHKKSLAYEPWPTYDEKYCVETAASFNILVNGKAKGRVEGDKDMGEKEVMDLAKKVKQVANSIDGKDIKKTVFVSGKVLNILV